MRRMVLISLAFLGCISAGVAADDPIAARKALMAANGKATKAVVPMLKGAEPFNLETVKAALETYIDAAGKMPALFPVGTETGGKTQVLPTAWSNKADFDAKFAKFGEDSKAALAAITDEASFKANFGPVLKNCGGCHEAYRAKDK